MKSEWRVMSNLIFDKKMYIVYRLLDKDAVVHTGNMEHYGEYMDSQDEAQAKADVLNKLTT